MEYIYIKSARRRGQSLSVSLFLPLLAQLLYVSQPCLQVQYLHDVDRVKVWVAEGQLPAKKLVALDQFLVLGYVEDLSRRLPQPPAM